jgi:hypothetical protein
MRKRRGIKRGKIVRVYMAVTADSLELPACVTDTAGEMAKFFKRPRRDILTVITRQSKTNDGYRILRVEIDDNEE